MAVPRSILRPLVSLSLPLLLLAGLGLGVAGDHDGAAADVAAGSSAADGDGRGRSRTASDRSVTTAVAASPTTVPPTTAPPTTVSPNTAQPVTEPPTTAPPTTSAPAAPVTEPAPEPEAAPEPPPAPAPEPPAPAPQPVSSVSPAPPPAFVPAPSGDIDTIVAHHNARRAELGLAPLSYNGCLAGLAANWSNYLASILGLLHQVGLGSLVGSCIDWRTAGENVGYSSLGAADVASGFFDSPAHRANILNAEFTEIGVGVAYADGRIFVTVMFGG